MSFILDALKKSETERQQQTGAEFSSVPSSSGEPQSFKWLWILALLLLVNVAVLLGVLLRPDRAPDVPVPVDASRRSNSVLRRQSRISLRRSYPQPIRRRSGSSRPR
jgi:hypothetical protein